jgi:Flp pilus assembly protein TadG
LQNAVNWGARAAVTGQLQSGGTDLVTSIAHVAEANSSGFLTKTLACSTLQIQFYDGLGNAVAAPISQGVVTVSVTGFPYKLITPILTPGQASGTKRVGSIGPSISVTASHISQPLDPLTNVTVGRWPAECNL